MISLAFLDPEGQQSLHRRSGEDGNAQRQLMTTANQWCLAHWSSCLYLLIAAVTAPTKSEYDQGRPDPSLKQGECQEIPPLDEELFTTIDNCWARDIQ